MMKIRWLIIIRSSSEGCPGARSPALTTRRIVRGEKAQPFRNTRFQRGTAAGCSSAMAVILCTKHDIPALDIELGSKALLANDRSSWCPWWIESQ